MHVDLKIMVLTSWSFPPAMGLSSAEEKNLWSYFCNMQWRDQIMRIYYRSASTGRIQMKPTFTVCHAVALILVLSRTYSFSGFDTRQMESGTGTFL